MFTAKFYKDGNVAATVSGQLNPDGSVPIGKTKLAAGEYSVEISSGSKTLIPFKATVKPKKTKSVETQDDSTEEKSANAEKTPEQEDDITELINLSESQNTDKLNETQYQKIGSDNSLSKEYQNQEGFGLQNSLENNIDSSLSAENKINATNQSNTDSTGQLDSVNQQINSGQQVLSDKTNLNNQLTSDQITNDSALSDSNSIQNLNDEKLNLSSDSTIYKTLDPASQQAEENYQKISSVFDTTTEQIKGTVTVPESTPIRTDVKGDTEVKQTYYESATGETIVKIPDSSGVTGETTVKLSDSSGVTGETTVKLSDASGVTGETESKQNNTISVSGTLNQNNTQQYQEPSVTEYSGTVEVNQALYKTLEQNGNNENIESEYPSIQDSSLDLQKSNTIDSTENQLVNKLTADKLKSDSTASDSTVQSASLDKTDGSSNSIYSTLNQNNEEASSSSFNATRDIEEDNKNLGSQQSSAKGETTLVRNESLGVSGSNSVNISESSGVTGETSIVVSDAKGVSGETVVNISEAQSVSGDNFVNPILSSTVSAGSDGSEKTNQEQYLNSSAAPDTIYKTLDSNAVGLGQETIGSRDSNGALLQDFNQGAVVRDAQGNIISGSVNNQGAVVRDAQGNIISGSVNNQGAVIRDSQGNIISGSENDQGTNNRRNQITMSKIGQGQIKDDLQSASTSEPGTLDVNVSEEQPQQRYRKITNENGVDYYIDEFGNKISSTDFSYEEFSGNSELDNTQRGLSVTQFSSINGVSESLSQEESKSQTSAASASVNQDNVNSINNGSSPNYTNGIASKSVGQPAQTRIVQPYTSTNTPRLTRSDEAQNSDKPEKKYNFIKKLSMSINKALGIEPQSDLDSEMFSQQQFDADEPLSTRTIRPKVTGIIESPDTEEDEEERRAKRKNIKYQKVGYSEPEARPRPAIALDNETLAYKDFSEERSRFDIGNIDNFNSAVLRRAEEEIEKQADYIKENTPIESSTQPSENADVENLYYLEILKERQRLEEAFEEERESNRLSIRKSEDNIQQQLLSLILSNQNVNTDSKPDDPINQLVQTLMGDDKKTSEQIYIDSSRIVQMIQNQITESGGQQIDEFWLRKRIEDELRSEFMYMQKEQEKKMKLVYKKMIEDMYMDMINN